ncbi:MAG: hypothetical protein JSS34_07300 [Proteobacteria bacterium]|nr:hypothetical protein [Pseudomonadota bacterium]
MLTSKFWKCAENLYDPSLGTEAVAPLLYYLIRTIRPKNVLEFGSGYSTLFILQALSDNLREFQLEKEALKRKNSSYKEEPYNEEFYNWLYSKDAPLSNPEYYMQEYKPQLVCFEQLPKNHPHTQKVLEAVKELDFFHLLTFIEGHACGQSNKIPDTCLPIDFAWNDAEAYENFFDEYWGLINSEDGYLLYHNTISSFFSHVSIMEKIKIRLEKFKNYELLNIVEPHKINQRSCTIIKKVSQSKKIYFDRPECQKQVYNTFLNFLKTH